MAAMDAPTRAKVYRAFMRANTEPSPFVKTVILTAVGNADDWMDSVQSAFNSALPAAFRNNATAAQKQLLFKLVFAGRYGDLGAIGED